MNMKYFGILVSVLVFVSLSFIVFGQQSCFSNSDCASGLCEKSPQSETGTCVPVETPEDDTEPDFTVTRPQPTYSCNEGYELKIESGQAYCLPIVKETGSTGTETSIESGISKLADPLTEGFIEVLGNLFSDFCENEKTLKEYFTETGNLKWKTYDCSCVNGACSQEKTEPIKLELTALITPPTFPEFVEEPETQETGDMTSIFTKLFNTIFKETGDITGFFSILTQPFALVDNLFGGLFPPILAQVSPEIGGRLGEGDAARGIQCTPPSIRSCKNNFGSIWDSCTYTYCESSGVWARRWRTRTTLWGDCSTVNEGGATCPSTSTGGGTIVPGGEVTGPTSGTETPKNLTCYICASERQILYSQPRNGKLSSDFSYKIIRGTESDSLPNPSTGWCKYPAVTQQKISGVTVFDYPTIFVSNGACPAGTPREITFPTYQEYHSPNGPFSAVEVPTGYTKTPPPGERIPGSIGRSQYVGEGDSQILVYYWSSEQ